MVEEAELDFINGGYEIDQNNPIEGRDGSRAELWFSYLRKVPESVPMPHRYDAADKTLTFFFRCTMISQQKWWFISKVDKVGSIDGHSTVHFHEIVDKVQSFLNIHCCSSPIW
jgi:hypothetical protein